MTQTPFLSICIPTFNRARFLPELFASIEAQLREVPIGSVEVVVSDNASTDDTATVLAAWTDRIPLRWQSNQQNIGPDRNYFAAMVLGHGEMAWLMGSDDALVPGGLAKVFADISIGGVHVYARTDCSVQLIPRRERRWTKIHGEYTASTIPELITYVNACVCVGGTFAYLSSLVVPRANTAGQQLPNWCWTSAYSHVEAIFRTLEAGAQLHYHPTSVVLCRLGNDSFMSEGLAKRILIDLEGYAQIADARVDLGLAAAIRRLASREHPLHLLARGYSRASQGSNESAQRFILVAQKLGWKSTKIISMRVLSTCGPILEYARRIKGRLLPN